MAEVYELGNGLNRLVWHQTGLVVECDSLMESFWICLSPVVGWVRFALIPGARAVYLPVEVRSAHEPAPTPLVSLQGVLWSRQEAGEAFQAICSYQQAADLIAQSCPQSRPLA